MWRRIFVFFATLSFAFGILFLSVLRTASIKYEFTGPVNCNGNAVTGEDNVTVDYFLASPGRVLPDSPFWPLKALRDRIWLFFTTNPGRKADLMLLFADKRLVSGEILFEQEKPELGFSTLTKAEKYLEQASLQEMKNRERGVDTSDFLQRLSVACLKHFEVMEGILKIAPEDARQSLVELQNYPRKIFSQGRDILSRMGKTPPENPFEW